jgi:predicted nucleic acid-binding protein
VTLILADTTVWMRQNQTPVAQRLAAVIEEGRAAMTLPLALEILRSSRDARAALATADMLNALRRIAITDWVERRARNVLLGLAWRGYHRGPSPVDLLAAAAAESVDAELWHCDRHFELIAVITGQPMRRLGE